MTFTDKPAYSRTDHGLSSNTFPNADLSSNVISEGLLTFAVKLNLCPYSKVMVVCLTDGRANISLKKSTGDPDYIGPEAIKPTNDELQDVGTED